MSARLANPTGLLPGVQEAIGGLMGAVHGAGIPPTILDLVHLRASQINGCGPCVEAGARSLRTAGESDERLATVTAWRETSYFTDAERAALALTEASTRLADRPDPVPDAVWEEAARHFDEPALAALVLAIATTNLFNRVNVPTRQQPGAW